MPSHSAIIRYRLVLIVSLLLICLLLASLPFLKSTPSYKTLSGQLYPIERDLGVIHPGESENEIARLNHYSIQINYYFAGTYTAGQFKGYDRIIAVKTYSNSKLDVKYLLATRDYKSYIVQNPNSSLNKFASKAFEEPDINTATSGEMVKIVTALPDDFPEIIDLGDGYLLRPSDYVLGISTSGLQQLDSQSARGLAIYQLSDYQSPTIHSEEDGIYNIRNVESEYIKGTTDYLLVDSTGLAAKYYLIHKSNLEPSNSHQEQPDYRRKSALSIDSTNIIHSANLYNKYDIAFPKSCANSLSTPILQNIHPIDLETIGDYDGRPIYKLKDLSHPLYSLAYYSKFKVHAPDHLAYSKYVSKTPIIITTDPWGNYMAMGEWDFPIPGECGKPVMYFYPITNTNISVQLNTQVSLNTQIPQYHDGWRILASKDGNLNDLQPQFTDCSIYSQSKLGTEYAYSACQNNQYPYIYWSGNVLGNGYPNPDRGWIVSRATLPSFFDSKLSEIGLLEKERQDMIDYWVPIMLQEPSPSYRVSFLQNIELDRFIPLKISPKPDTMLRVFLDYTPIYSDSLSDIIPQQLTRMNRQGFTVVEWGGLKR